MKQKRNYSIRLLLGLIKFLDVTCIGRMFLHLRKFENTGFELLNLMTWKCGGVAFQWKELKRSSPAAGPC